MSITDASHMTRAERDEARITSVQPIIGLEVHVELATQSKMFTRARCPAAPEVDQAPPNTFIDPLVLALPGALPVPNALAIELSIAVGLALGCQIADVTRFDRKSYFYPDLPKAYQISQYDRPLCFDGSVRVPPFNQRGEADLDAPRTPIRITRAHLEEDAGKLLHEAPGGRKIDGSIVDLNRAGTPLLEIVTEPDFTTPQQVEAFCRWLRHTVRLMAASQGILQDGHMRFEPNINCVLTLENGATITTPIVEVKNLNSFRAVVGAIEYELQSQPGRWREDGRVMGAGAKVTRGWDDANMHTLPQREKEDAHDYRYFPDPDLPPVRIAEGMLDRARARLGRPWLEQLEYLVADLGLTIADASIILGDPATAELFWQTQEDPVAGGDAKLRARTIANAIAQKLTSLAKEQGCTPGSLGIRAPQLASVVGMRIDGEISSNGMDEALEALARGQATDARELAEQRGLLIVQDAGAVDAWCNAAIQAHPQAAEEVRSGKQQAMGRLIGHAMKEAKGSGDPKSIRQRLSELLSET